MSVDDDRLSEIEKRLARLESRIPELPQTQAPATPAPKAQAPVPRQTDPLPAPPSIPTKVPPAIPAQSVPQPVPVARTESATWTVTKLLGWGGAVALVMAASYLIRLAITDGWLTPERQVMSAVLAGLVLIAVGLRLRGSDRELASLLPAGGIVILFLSILGAHLYYELIGVTTAGLAVIAVCLGSLVLCSLFDSQMYALFAVVGSYSAPFMLNAEANNIIDIVVYYCSWSLLFCAYAIWVRNRRVYLLALYLALVGFDMLWRSIGSDAWLAASIFQLSQFVIFASCAVLFAMRHKDPMNKQVAMAHAPALLIFYALEYAVLDRFVPEYAPWIAVLSAALLLVAYRIARQFIGQSMAGSKLLLAAYSALVLLHAGYLESVPDEWAPWVAPIAIAVSAIYLAVRRKSDQLWGPIGAAIGIVFVANYVRALTGSQLADVPASDWLLVVYAVQLYLGYYFIQKEPAMIGFSIPLIYAGHVAAMAAPLHYFDGPFMVSLSWGVLALVCLGLSLNVKDKALGKSSLLIFAVSVVKVLAYDLSDAAPLIRISVLVVLGVTLYLGGWLYKRIEAMESPRRVT